MTADKPYTVHHWSDGPEVAIPTQDGQQVITVYTPTDDDGVRYVFVAAFDADAHAAHLAAREDPTKPTGPGPVWHRALEAATADLMAAAPRGEITR